VQSILYEKSFNLKTISQGEFGHFRENDVIILSKVAKIVLKIVFKLKLFPYKICPRGQRAELIRKDFRFFLNGNGGYHTNFPYY